MDPRLNARDQVMLMNTAMDLPDSERDEKGYEQDRSEVKGGQRRDAPARQGFCSASCGAIGIMFWSR